MPKFKKKEQETIDPNKLSEYLASGTQDPREKLRAKIRAKQQSRQGTSAIKRLQEQEQENQEREREKQEDTSQNNHRYRRKREKQKMKQLEKKLGQVDDETYLEALDKVAENQENLNYYQRVIDLYNKQNDLNSSPEWNIDL